MRSKACLLDPSGCLVLTCLSLPLNGTPGFDDNIFCTTWFINVSQLPPPLLNSNNNWKIICNTREKNDYSRLTEQWRISVSFSNKIFTEDLFCPECTSGQWRYCWKQTLQLCVCVKNSDKYASEDENNHIRETDWVVVSLYWRSGPVFLFIWQCDIGVCMAIRMRLRRWAGVGLYIVLQARAGSMDFTWSTTGGHWRVSDSKRYDLIYVQVTPGAVWRPMHRWWG